ncbi:MAG: hypothetical protein OHK0017_11950 [Patescibacteria group bacterium]
MSLSRKNLELMNSELRSSGLMKNKFRKLVVIPIAASICAIFLPISTQAVTYHTQLYSCSVPLTRTDWQTGDEVPPILDHCGLTKFDPALGTLTAVEITLNSHIESQAQVENLDSQPRTVTTNISANVRLTYPGGSPNLLSTLPTYSQTDNFAAFDNTIDYAGASGRIYSNALSDSTATTTLTLQSDLNLFTASAPGMVETAQLPAIATSDSDFTGSANLATIVNTFASASATVRYSYDAHDLATTQTVEGTIQTGNEITLIVNAENRENEATAGTLTVTDQLPAGVEFLGVDSPNWTAVNNNGTLTLTTTTSIPALGSTPIRVRVKLPSTPTTLVNNATIAGPKTDAVPSNNPSVQSLNITQTPVVAVTNNTNPTSNTSSNTQTMTGLQGPLVRSGALDSSHSLNWIIYILSFLALALPGVLQLQLKPKKIKIKNSQSQK